MCCAARRKPSANKVPIRGKFGFNTNNFPVWDWYAAGVLKEPGGQISTALREKIFEDRGDAYGQDCKMK
jgi:branched-chain amino acid transport system substrate-binding protein